MENLSQDVRGRLVGALQPVVHGGALAMGRQRGGGHREPMLHADAQRLLAAGGYPPRGKHTILMALRGGRPGKQVCLACGKTARRCQFWVPPELLQVASASTAKPAVYWWCCRSHR